MNRIQKYKLYRKLKNPGPTTSNRNGYVESDIFRIDWNYTDGNVSYFIKSVYGGDDIFFTDVLLNGKTVTTFTGRRARTLFHLAKSVMAKEKVYGNVTYIRIIR